MMLYLRVLGPGTQEAQSELNETDYWVNSCISVDKMMNIQCDIIEINNIILSNFDLAFD